MHGGVESTGGNTSPPPKRSPTVRAQRTFRRSASALRDQWELRTDTAFRRWAREFELPDGSRRVYCHHVRKTAGTSLFLSFMALGGEDPLDVWRRLTRTRLQRTFSGAYAFAANDRRVLAEGAYLFGRSHRPVFDQPLPPGTHTVTILRDPVDRVHSYFDYLVVGDAPDTPGRVSDRERLLAQGGFDSFLDRVPVPDLLTQVAMFSERLDVSEAAERIGDCSTVFFTEDFAHGLDGIARQLRLPLASQRARVTNSRSTLTEAQRERLRVRLEPEYELLDRLSRAGIARIGDRGTP